MLVNETGTDMMMCGPGQRQQVDHAHPGLVQALYPVA
jgi:hypothetical protein